MSAVTVTKFIFGVSNKNFIDCNRFLVFLTLFAQNTGKYLLKLKNPNIQHNIFILYVTCAFYSYISCSCCGPGSSVGIATDYGLDISGSNLGGDEIFRPSRPALGPTQPPVKWVLGLSRGKVRPGPAADHSPPSSATVMEV